MRGLLFLVGTSKVEVQGLAPLKMEEQSEQTPWPDTQSQQEVGSGNKTNEMMLKLFLMKELLVKSVYSY